jgi:lipopolysaccharide export system protein LptA
MSVLLALRVGYGLVVSPLVNPPASRAGINASPSSGQSDGSTTGSEEAPATSMPQQRRDLLDVAAESLPHAPWSAQARYALRSSNAYIFTEEWEKEENSNRVRFEPFAIVYRTPDAPADDPPLTIVCDTAVLEFAEKFDIRNPRPGRVVGGSLLGPVAIRGPNGLAANTHNFSFSESAQRAWSDHEIDFTWGGHSGRAQGIELDLIPQVGKLDEDKPAIAGIRTLRLVSNVHLTLQPGAEDRRKANQPQPSGKPRAPVRITCTGNFEYKLEVQVAVFHKNVEVIQPTSETQSDRLSTDTLTLEFVRDKNEAQVATDAPATDVDPTAPPADNPRPSPAGGGFSDLKFRWLRASGPKTVVSSDRSELKATLQELTYDEPAREVTLKGTSPVRVEQKNHRLQSTEIAVTLDEEGDVETAHCRGNGRLVRYTGRLPKSEDEPLPRIDFAAKWEGDLRLEPRTDQPGSTIDLQQRVVLTRPGGMRLLAERVRIWLAEEASSSDTPAPRRRRGEFNDDGRTRPERMLALRQVELKSPQLVGATERLEIWFQPGRLGPPPAGPESLEPDVTQLTPRATPLANSPLRRVALRDPDQAPGVQAAANNRPVPAGPKPGNPPGSPRAAQPRPAANPAADGPAALDPLPGPEAEPVKGKTQSPILVSADVIRVQMLLDADDAEVERIRTEGHVHVTQNHGPGQIPLDVKGEQLHVWNYTEERQVLRVQGKPAHVHDRGLQLEGDDIRFDRGANQASVQGKGVLRMPVRNGIDGKKLPDAQLVDIFWQEKMEFDGQTARFFSGVKTQLNGTELSCEEMQVRLTRRVSFIEDNAQREPELETVLCRDRVNIKSAEYQDNKLQSVRLATGHEFQFEQATGDLNSNGPGILTFWTRNTNRPEKKGRAGTANRNPIAQGNSPWNFTQVTYSGRMKGNAEKRRSQFFDRVRVVYGPVNTPTEQLDVDRLPEQAGTLRCEELTVTQVVAPRDKSEHVTVLGRGNCEIEGRMKEGYFSALAYSVSFDQSKGMYVLAGDGRRDAELSRESQPGVSQPAVQKAKRFEFFPERNELNVIEASSATGGA